jgi:hypothetical protein
METTINITGTPNEILSVFNKGINKNASIKFYEFVAPSRCKALIRHCEGLELKEGATYSLKGFLSRCETKLDKLKRKLFDLESKLFDERCRQNEMLERRCWGYGMTHSKIGFSTRREDSIKERIEEVKQQIKALENGR